MSDICSSWLGVLNIKDAWKSPVIADVLEQELIVASCSADNSCFCLLKGMVAEAILTEKISIKSIFRK